jgi:hypothetical protein
MTMSNTVLHLSPNLDLAMAAALKADLALMPAGARVVDAGDVRRVTTPCLQVLLAARPRFSRVSEAFLEAATLLGLAQALDLGGAPHA